MALFPVIALLTVFSLKGVTAQNGVTIAFLTDGATIARGTTLILRVVIPEGTEPGLWFRSPFELDENRVTRRRVGNIYELEVRDIIDDDEGEYYYVKGSEIATGRVLVVENVINGQWGPWSDWVVPVCPVTCGGATRSRTRTRACDTPPPQFGGNLCDGASEQAQVQTCGTTSCNEQEYRIIDLIGNHVAYRGENIAFRYTPASTPTQEVWFKQSQIQNNDKYNQSSTDNTYFLAITDLQDEDAGQYFFLFGIGTAEGTLTVIERPVDGICADATRRNNIGYLYHPSDCDKYIQCYDNPDGQELAVYRTCPYGHYWSMRSFSCEEYWKVDDCPVEKCTGSCGMVQKITGSCGGYWECGEMGPRPVCCPGGYGFFSGRGCHPTLPSGEEMCPVPYACTDACEKRPVWTDTNKYEMYAGSQSWVERDCEDGMYFDIGYCGCINRDVPCESVRNYDLNSNVFGNDVDATSVTSDGTYLIFNDDSRFSINVQGVPAGYPKVLRVRYRQSGNTRSELVTLTNPQGHRAVVIYTGEDQLHFRFTAWTNCEEDMVISTKGMTESEWKLLTLWYDGRHVTAVVSAGDLKNRARVYAPNIAFLENRIHLGTTDMVFSSTLMNTVPFNGHFDYVTIDTCDGGLLV